MKQLIHLAVAGDETAFAALIEPYKGKLTATAYAYTKDYMEAQDVVQETLLQAYKSLHQLKEPRYFATWLYKIAIRQCFHVVRAKKQAQLLVFELQQLDVHAHTPDFEALHTALQQLNDTYRTVVLLHYFYDFKLHEIAALLDKPLNTVKIQLHRARQQLKSQLTKQTPKQDVKQMLTQLQSIAMQYFAISPTHTLAMADMGDDEASFLWKENEQDDGYYIRLSASGKLLSLSQPLHMTSTRYTVDEQQQLATKLLLSHYPKALDYFTLVDVKQKPTSTRFYYRQLVARIPLANAYCTIEMAANGQLVEFEYRPYQTTPPTPPATFAPTEPIVAQLVDSDWTLQLEYLTSAHYSVAQSGLYAVYYSPLVHHSFRAATGENLIKEEPLEETPAPMYVTPRTVEATEPLATPEEILGIPASMKRIREADVDNDCTGIVWRDEAHKPPHEPTLQTFMLDRFEETVKATVRNDTGELRSVVWFKERRGELALSYDECEHIALTFLQTYFSAYMPYVKMKVDDGLNEQQRAFFHFGLFVDDVALEGEFFSVAVNKTTGLIDSLLAPKLDAALLDAYEARPLLPLAEAKQALSQVDATLAWDVRHRRQTSTEQLIYRFAHAETKQRVRYVDAVTGELICMNY